MTTQEDEYSDGEWVDCWECGGEGYVGHECGEDTCVCLYPQDNQVCETCNGEGGWIKGKPRAKLPEYRYREPQWR